MSKDSRNALSISSTRTFGVPIVAPTDDYNAISQTLSEMTRAHPGQLFIVEDYGGAGSVVTWIPIWAAENIVMQSFLSALLPNMDSEWPTIR
jgi:hypothetical protein